MPKILEVIVTSVEEAIEAEAGGADRLELVRDLEAGGLTPPLAIVEEVLERVSLPVRVMLRHQPTMSADSENALRALERDAVLLSRYELDGLVAGFLKAAAADCVAVSRILSAAPEVNFTFHRAFDEVSDPLTAIKLLTHFPQIDRVLTSGGEGAWPTRKSRLLRWQAAGEPSLRILLAAGIDDDVHRDLKNVPELAEVHVGRAVRKQQSVSGPVLRTAVRALKSTLE